MHRHSLGTRLSQIRLVDIVLLIFILLFVSSAAYILLAPPINRLINKPRIEPDTALIDANQQKWQSASIIHYRMVVHGPPDDTLGCGSPVVEVLNGGVIEIEYVTEASEDFKPYCDRHFRQTNMEYFFDYIRQEYVTYMNGKDWIYPNVEYDPHLGYPTNYSGTRYIHRSFAITDFEILDSN